MQQDDKTIMLRLERTIGQELGTKAKYNKHGQLMILNFSYLDLTLLPTELGLFSSLRQLDLSHNQLTHVPAELAQLSNLQRLGLSYNQLTRVPIEPGYLSNLQVLDLSHNQLTDLPIELGLLSNLQQYEPYLYPIFLRLMEKFDLSYQIEPDRPGQRATHSLVPQLLPYQPPEDLPGWPDHPNHGQTHLQMVYRFDFVPAGIMSWFIVRTHRYTLGKHWREGVFLVYQEHYARVELNPMLREIRLVVWGIQPHNFFTILKDTLDLILSRFEGLRMRREVPCICHWETYFRHRQRGFSKIILGYLWLLCYINTCKHRK